MRQPELVLTLAGFGEQPCMASHRHQLVALAAPYAIPVIYEYGSSSPPAADQLSLLLEDDAISHLHNDEQRRWAPIMGAPCLR